MMMTVRTDDELVMCFSGTNSEMGEETTASTNQEEEADVPLDCSKSSKSLSPSDHESRTEESMDAAENEDEALDLSTKKRRRSEDSGDRTPAQLPKRANTTTSSKAPRSSSDKSPSAFPSPVQSMPLLNFSADGFLSAASQSSTPYVPLYVPPFRFPTFPPACPPLASPASSANGQKGEANADSLSKLSSLVHQVGKGQKATPVVVSGAASSKTPGDPELGTNDNASGLQEALGAAAGHGLSFQELWLRFVKKEENAELKRLNEAKQIFTCLQCHASFQTMEQLVKHMETTQHYANIPKHYR